MQHIAHRVFLRAGRPALLVAALLAAGAGSAAARVFVGVGLGLPAVVVPPPLVVAPTPVVLVPPPPPPPPVYVAPRHVVVPAGAVSIPGAWHWGPAGYVWRAGRYAVPPRRGAIWVAGGWARGPYRLGMARGTLALKRQGAPPRLPTA